MVLDGNDGSGKATQAKLLIERLQAEGRNAQKVDFPAYTRNVFGALIGECLAGKHGDFVNLDPKIASSLYALDRFESSKQIEDMLASGVTVIADRFSSSNQMHQGGKIADESERVTFLGWLDHMEHTVLGIPRPDLVIYLRVPLEVSLTLLSEKRAVKNSMLAEGVKDTVEEDRQYLQRSAETASWLLGREKNWTVVECMEGERLRTPDEIHTDVWKVVEAAVAYTAQTNTMI